MKIIILLGKPCFCSLLYSDKIREKYPSAQQAERVHQEIWQYKKETLKSTLIYI